MNVFQSNAAVGNPSTVPAVSVLALRTNCTTASFPAGRSPTPSLFASSSIAQLSLQ